MSVYEGTNLNFRGKVNQICCTIYTLSLFIMSKNEEKLSFQQFEIKGVFNAWEKFKAM